MRYVALSCLIAFAYCASAAAGETYRLRPGDKIEIWTSQDALLNRQITVAPDGRIAAPLAGHLVAAGLSLEELEQQLGERLRPYYRETVDLTVILTSTTTEEKSATIYVEGEVERPGLYPFRDNMVVLHAVSAAGGYFRSAKTGRDGGGTKREDLLTVTRKLGQILLKEARLRAELDDRKSILLPEPLNHEPDPELATALQQENAILTSRRTTFDAQMQSRERVLESLKREVAALDAQVSGAQQTVEAQMKDQEVVRGLAQKGLVTGARESDAARLTYLAVSHRQDAQVRLIKAQGIYAETAASLPALREQRRSDLLSEIQTVWHEAANLRAQRSMLASGDSETTRPKTYRYEILRTVAGAVQRIPVTDLQPIQPGDMISVRSGSPERSSESTLGAGPSESGQGPHHS